MGMNVTDTGIDWDRLTPEDADLVAAYADEAAASCNRPEETTLYYRHLHYQTIGGETRCSHAAQKALQAAGEKYGANREVYAALQRALGSTRAEAFAAHVR